MHALPFDPLTQMVVHPNYKPLEPGSGQALCAIARVFINVLSLLLFPHPSFPPLLLPLHLLFHIQM